MMPDMQTWKLILVVLLDKKFCCPHKSQRLASKSRLEAEQGGLCAAPVGPNDFIS